MKKLYWEVFLRNPHMQICKYASYIIYYSCIVSKIVTQKQTFSGATLGYFDEVSYNFQNMQHTCVKQTHNIFVKVCW